MRVLVTGAGGFLGLHLANRLAESGHEVRALVRREPEFACWRGLAVEVMYGDVTDAGAMRTAVAGRDVVLNFAGKLYAPGIPASVFEGVNAYGVKNIVDACLSDGHVSQLIHCSTTGVLGETGPVLAAEDAPYRPTNDYERTKMEGEKIALAAGEQGLPVTVLRPGMVYGPYDMHLLGLFKTIKYGLFRLVGPGTNHFHPIYLSDFLDGVELTLGNEKAYGRIYHLAGERPATVREFTDEIATSLGRRIPRAPITIPVARFIGRAMEAVPLIPKERLPLSQSRVAFLLSDRTYSIVKAKAELGYSPKVSLPDGIHIATNWYASNGYL